MCLTHTYLSKYVETSNKDKYHRGAKSCFGKWIPEWHHPLVPDAMPYGIGQSGWSEQRGRRGESRADNPACHALGQKIPEGRHSRIEEQPREWPQAHHQHPKRQGSCKRGNQKTTQESIQGTGRLGGSDLNIFGMIDRNCVHHVFITEENINSDRFIEFMDNFSLCINKETVVILVNSTVHKSCKVKDCLQRWKERGLHIFYLPPYYSIFLLTSRISTSRKRFGEF